MNIDKIKNPKIFEDYVREDIHAEICPKKKKKAPCHTKHVAKETDYSQKTIQNWEKIKVVLRYDVR